MRNLYILISATGSDSISSVEIENDSAGDGLLFDKLAVLPSSTAVIPEPSTIVIWSLLGLVSAGVQRRGRRKAARQLTG